jgi:hypothetical protein
MKQFGTRVAVFVFGLVMILGVAFPSIRLGDLTDTLTRDIFANFVVLTTVAQGAMWLWRRHRSLG